MWQRIRLHDEGVKIVECMDRGVESEFKIAGIHPYRLAARVVRTAREVERNVCVGDLRRIE